MAVYLGQKAPGFLVNTTKGPLSLEDYKGKWVILFSHPADFTPVCTTEFMAFAKRYDEFKKINTELIGLSVDSIYSHIEWMKNIKEKFGIEVPFPVIADINKDVAREYNMMDEKTGSTVRGVFVIDPNMVVRLMIYYPAETGRNIDEIMRTLKALQMNWDRKLATPVNWQPGNDGIVSAPGNLDEAINRENNGSKTWYLTYEAVR